jgi:aspartate-semialdehyde dehydrogenase
MATPLESKRIVIAGASSLLGTELKALLEESRFAASDFRLVDEETAAGTLTEAAGEAAVIQPVEEDSFEKAWCVFFAGSPRFTNANYALATGSGAHVVDLSGELAGRDGVRSWLPKFGKAASDPRPGRVFAVPSAAGEIAARLVSALDPLGLTRLSGIAFEPVSAAGKAGVEELESQTGQLLSFQPVGKQVFDAQVAYTLLDRYGPASRRSLAAHLEILRREVRSCLAADIRPPSLLLVHAPVFYGAVLSACGFLGAALDAARVREACLAAGFTIAPEETPPSNVSTAGEAAIQLACPKPDPSSDGAWWFWAAADDLRLPAVNAVRLAEKLLG